MRHSVPCVWIKRSPLALSQKLRLMVITGVLSCFTQQVGLCDLLIMFILLFSSQKIHMPVFGTYLGCWKFISGKFHVGLLELKLKVVYLGHYKNRHLQSQGFGGTWHCFVIKEVACTYISSSHLARVFSKKRRHKLIMEIWRACVWRYYALWHLFVNFSAHRKCEWLVWKDYG